MDNALTLVAGKFIAENNHISLPKLPGAYTGLLNRLSDRSWEWRLGIDTSGRREIHFRDAERYEAVPYYVYFKIFERIGLEPNDVVVDLGSGEGRMVFSAAQQKVKEVIGVEIDPALHAIAVGNARKIRCLRSPVRLLRQSAADLDFSGVTVVCMFNPFGETVMRKMLEALHRSLQQEPRPLQIVYLNAVWGHLLVAQPWLELYDAWKMSLWNRVKSPVHFYRTLPSPFFERPENRTEPLA